MDVFDQGEGLIDQRDAEEAWALGSVVSQPHLLPLVHAGGTVDPAFNRLHYRRQEGTLACEVNSLVGAERFRHCEQDSEIDEELNDRVQGLRFLDHSLDALGSREGERNADEQHERDRAADDLCDRH